MFIFKSRDTYKVAFLQGMFLKIIPWMFYIITIKKVLHINV